MKILIVDDSRVSRQILTELIKEFDSNYDVIADAVDGKDGYDKFIKLQPDIIISDFQMPNINGLELLELVRKSCEHTKVIMITATVDERVKKKIQTYDNTYILSKPLKNDLFKDVLKNIKDVK